MDLKQKLARLGSAGPGSRSFRPSRGQPLSGTSPADAKEAVRRERVERLREMMSGVIARRQRKLRDRPAVEISPAVLPGELRETPHGPVHVVEQVLEPGHCHGRVPIADALGVDPALVARIALDPALEGMDPSRMLLLDTETTGLSGGTGTLAFLIGIAWFEDQSLHVEQFFLRRPGEEAPMLRLLSERLSQASCLVTYNGKAFDWPLIRARYVMNRVAMPSPPMHLDLLHCARRIYKRRLERVRLVHMEAEVLGMHRERDVDGAEIPGLYLDYLRGDHSPDLTLVIEHNANDLVALAAILGEMTRRFETLHAEDDPRDHYGFARVAERADDPERAVAFARAAAQGGGEPALTLEAHLLAARVWRRRGDVAAEELALVAALDCARHTSEEARAEVHLLLAKHYEHRHKDVLRALWHAHRTTLAEGEDGRSRRVARLLGRLDRRRARAGSQR